jgi:hypothetical protein
MGYFIDTLGWIYPGAQFEAWQGSIPAMAISEGEVESPTLQYLFTSEYYEFFTVVYRDPAFSGKLSSRDVIDYGIGTTVYSPGFTSSPGKTPAIGYASNNGDLRYIAYSDQGQGNRVSVFIIGQNYLGSPGFSEGEAEQISIVIRKQSVTAAVPYVSFKDLSANGKLTVMKYNDTKNWVPVGKTAFSVESVSYTSLAVYYNTLYVAFSDGSQSGKVTVMKYEEIN